MFFELQKKLMISAEQTGCIQKMSPTAQKLLQSLNRYWQKN